MQAKHSKISTLKESGLPTTWQEAQSDFINGKPFVMSKNNAYDIVDVVVESRGIPSHPLVCILLTWLECKINLVKATVLSKEKLEESQQYYAVSTVLIKDAINILTIEELKNVRVIFFQDHSLLSFLAVCGAEDLFYETFKKLEGHLDSDELKEIVSFIYASYAGETKIPRPLKLANREFGRGDECYVRLLRVVLETSMRQNNIEDLLADEDQSLKDLLDEIQILRKQTIDYFETKLTLEKFLEVTKEARFGIGLSDDQRVEAAYQYQKYIADHNGIHLVDKLIADFITVELILQDLADIKDDTGTSQSNKINKALFCINTKLKSLTPDSAALLKDMLCLKTGEGKEFNFLTYQQKTSCGFLGFNKQFSLSSIMNSLDSIIAEDAISEEVKSRLGFGSTFK